ncbi:MAG: flagellar basal body rod protein FlgB, partial [Nitrospiria bacterium]
MIISLFNKTMSLMAQALNLRSERHRVISSNIANQDTPGYQAKEIRFKEIMNAVNDISPQIRLKKTNPAHVSTSAHPSSPMSARATRSPATGSTRLDGNTVKGEEEMAKLAENTLMYNATAQIIASKFRGLKNA